MLIVSLQCFSAQKDEGTVDEPVFPWLISGEGSLQLSKSFHHAIHRRMVGGCMDVSNAQDVGKRGE